MAKKKKKLMFKIPGKTRTSYQTLLAHQLDLLTHKLRFTFHEYKKQMPSEMQTIYEIDSKWMRENDCWLLVLRNSSKKICGHFMIDREFYLTQYKVSQREDIEYISRSIQDNFIVPMEKLIDVKENA